MNFIFESYLKTDDECQFHSQYFPMCRCEIPFGVSEGSITTFLLVQFTPIFVRWSGKREIDIARHVPLVFVLVDQFGNEFRRKSNQKSLKKKERKRKLHTGLKTSFFS